MDITGLHAFYQLFCWLTGQRIEILEIGCSRQRQEELQPFLVLFNATSMASTANYSFSFAAALLESSLVRNRSELDEFLRVYPCSIFGNFDYSGTGTQVRAFLDAAVQQGSPIPSLGQLALVMHVSEITLRRRLRQEGNSYRELRDACLTEAAQHRLVQGDVSIDKISEALGFSDATAFRRSFKRCTGLSPSASEILSIDTPPCTSRCWAASVRQASRNSRYELPSWRKRRRSPAPACWGGWIKE